MEIAKTTKSRLEKISRLVLDLNLEIRHLNESTRLLNREDSLKRIAYTVASAFKLSPDVMIKKDRQQKLIVARLMFYHIARSFNYKYQELADYVDRNHSTISVNCANNNLTLMVRNYPKYKTEIIDSLCFNGLSYLVSNLEE